MKFNKKIKTVLIISALTIGISGCGGQSSNKGSSDSNKLNMNEEIKKDPNGKRIVLLTNNSGGDRENWIKEKSKEAGFNVEVVGMGAGEIAARVIAEAENPTTNVVWGPSEELFNQMIDANALAKFKPTWADDVADTYSENGYSYPYEYQPKLWIANKEISNLPKTVNDLWEKEEFHGKYTVPTTFDGATNRAIIGSILGQYLDEDGELGVSDDGWKAIKSFFEYGVKTPEGEDTYENMISGKTPITFSFASGIYNLENLYGKGQIIYFENGQPDNTNQIGVVNNKDPEVLAESIRFANWICSPEVLADYASKNGNILVNKKLKDDMVPVAQDISKNFKSQDLDWEKINKLMDDWVAKIQLEIY